MKLKLKDKDLWEWRTRRLADTLLVQLIGIYYVT